MKHYQKIANQALRTQTTDQLARQLFAFSNRLDMLEKFISDNTHFDGQKVGFTLTHGPTKQDWYKDEYYQIDGTIKFPEEK